MEALSQKSPIPLKLFSMYASDYIITVIIISHFVQRVSAQGLKSVENLVKLKRNSENESTPIFTLAASLDVIIIVVIVDLCVISSCDDFHGSFKSLLLQCIELFLYKPISPSGEVFMPQQLYRPIAKALDHQLTSAAIISLLSISTIDYLLIRVVSSNRHTF